MINKQFKNLGEERLTKGMNTPTSKPLSPQQAVKGWGEDLEKKC